MPQQDLRPTQSQSPPENYERYFVPAIGAPLAQDLVTIASLRPGERVLDVACGTGVVARLAAKAVGPEGEVTGLDLNPGMLAAARAHDGGLPITWQEGDAQSMPWPDGSYDVVFCQMGLQFMPDKGAALAEMHRVLAPGGRLAVNVPGPLPPAFATMETAVGHHVGPEAAGFVRAVFSLHDTAEITALLEEAGFHDLTVEADVKTLHLPAPEEFLWQYIRSTPMAGLVAQADENSQAALERDVVAEWQGQVNGGAFDVRQRVVQAMGMKAG